MSDFKADMLIVLPKLDVNTYTYSYKLELLYFERCFSGIQNVALDPVDFLPVWNDMRISKRLQ